MKATLRLRVNMLSKSYRHDIGVEFPYDAQEGDASVVVTVASVTLILVEDDDLDISHVLRHGSLSPTLAKDIMKRLQEGIFAALDEVWGDAISTRYFAAGEAVDRFAKISEGWFSIQFLHDGQRFNGIKG